MTGLAVAKNSIPAMSQDAIAKVRQLEAEIQQLPQVVPPTTHVIHAGMYARTIRIPAGVVLSGALIKIPTLLILNGHATVFVEAGPMELAGYHVLPASGGTKRAFFAHADTDLTMLFPSKAKTVEEAENEFTEETGLLLSRGGASLDTVIITGE